MQSPPLTDNTIDRSYAICIATPHDPVEDEQVFMNQLKRNNMQYYSLERFQIWYNRLVRGRRSNLSTNNTGAINPADSS